MIFVKTTNQSFWHYQEKHRNFGQL